MDGDMQHDEALLPKMLAMIKEQQLDVVVGTRYGANGSVGDWQRSRVVISGLASRLARLVIKAELTDPLSGFFLIARGAFAATMRNLSGQGFKILLDIFASSPRPLAFAELPFHFRRRIHGESKLDTLVAWEYLTLLLDKLAGPIIPVRFLLFAMIGGFGVLTHLATLWLTVYPFGIGFAGGQAIATIVAMTGNFLLNNLFTYRDRRLHGRSLATGLLSFYAVCGLGAAANVGIASHLFNADHSWWLAGLGGAAIGAVWELCHVIGLHLAIARDRGAGSTGASSDHLGRAERRASELAEPLRSLKEPGERVHSRSPFAAATCYGPQRIQPLDRIRRKPWLNRNRRPLASRSVTSFQG